MQEDIHNIDAAFVRRFNFVFASPPCQLYSRGTLQYQNKGLKTYPDLIPYTRELLKASGVPSVIENVPESGIRPDFMLCGTMFGLPIMRHRHFEVINWKPDYSKLYCNHTGSSHVIAGSFKGSIHDAANSMGCYPTRLRSELKEGIPPAYIKFVFDSFLTSAQLFNISPAH